MFVNIDYKNSEPIIENTIKKRGRKPKIVKDNTDNLINQEVSPDILNPQLSKINNSNDNLKKKGRKSNMKLLNLDNQCDYDIVSNLVAYLPLKCNDIKKILINKIVKIDNILDNNNVSFNEIIHHNIIIDPNIVKTESKECLECINTNKKISQLNDEIKQLKEGLIDIKSNFNKKIYESKVNFLNKNTNLWDETTNILCWWCCHKFDNIPIGIPEYIITSKNTFYLYGCFCSFNCMMAYNLDVNDNKVWERQSNIYQLKNKIDPDNNISIHPALPRQILNIFGGPLNIKEYRETFFLLNIEYRYILPPMISINCIFEELLLNNSINKKVEKNYDNLLIKRKKPLIKQSVNLNIYS